MRAPVCSIGAMLYDLLSGEREDGQVLKELIFQLDITGVDGNYNLWQGYQENPEQISQFLLALITEGFSPVDLQDTKKTESKTIHWNVLLADYCNTFHANPYEVWNETPLPFFLQMCAELPAIKSMQKLDIAVATGAGMGGGKNAKQWQETSEKYRKTGGKGEPSKSIENVTEDDVKQEREAAKRELQ